MKSILKKSTLSLALLAAATGATWSSVSYACPSEAMISSICVMAAVKSDSFNGGAFLLANGASQLINQNQALYSLIGTTYGGNTTNFNLPDLRGRVVIGAGQGAGLPAYSVGDKGGANSVALTVNNLPPHVHALVTAAGGVVVTVGGNITAATTLSGLTTTTNLAGVQFTSSSSNLTMQATATPTTATPSSATTLAKLTTSGVSSLYGTGTPNIAMAANSVTGTVSGTLAGTAPGTVSGGTATTTITGLPTVTIGGQTGSTGMGASFSVMQPYLVMNYFIAVQGVYPMWD